MKKFINLQLFATAMNTLEGNTASTNYDVQALSIENKTFYDKVLLKSAQPNLVHGQWAQKRPIPKNVGKTIEFRKYGALDKALTPLTEGETPKGSKLSVTNLTAEVSQYGDFTVLTDMLEMAGIDKNVVEATEVLGNQMGVTLDTVTRDAMHLTNNVYYCPKGDGTATAKASDLDNTCTLTVDVVKRVAAILKKSNTPKIDGSYIGIIHPYVAYDLMNDPAWIDAQKYTNNVEKIYEGEIGKIGGVRFVESSEALIEDGVFYTLIFGANAYAETEIEGFATETIVKQLGSSGVNDALNQRGSVGWKSCKAAKVLNHDYIVDVASKTGGGFEVEDN